MNKVQEFLNEKFGEVRVVNINNVLWFVASDVAKSLQYPKASDMTRNLDNDETDTQTLLIRSDNGTEQNRKCLIINESGLYSAVLSITKRNVERYEIARDFKRWITGTVIPAIRKDDAYISGEENIDMNNEEKEAEFVLQAINILQKKIERLQKENSEMKPKVDKWGQFLDSNGTYNFTECAKLISTMAQEEKAEISISAVKLTEFLRNEGILSKTKSPDKVKNGKVKKGSYKNLPNKPFEDYFNVSSIHINDTMDKTQTKVKSKGVEFIYDLIKDKYKAV